jgi:Asp-tRNA(Asn)/Glu-tRNA(Gln) amidotransferase A subunit family amidase
VVVGEVERLRFGEVDRRRLERIDDVELDGVGDAERITERHLGEGDVVAGGDLVELAGGEGASVGAGIAPFGLGADVGGSIRLPAFFNGVLGHKATGGLIPNAGQWPITHGKALRYLTTGPLARRAEDLWPLVRLLAGPVGNTSFRIGGEIVNGRDAAERFTEAEFVIVWTDYATARPMRVPDRVRAILEAP